MKNLIAIMVLFSVSSSYAVEGVVCKGADCTPVEINENEGRGLVRLRDDQSKKLDAVKNDPANDNYLFKEETAQEQGLDLKFHEISVGTCLIDPQNTSVYYKVLEKDEKSTKIRYVVEKENHQFMLRGNYVFWKLPDTSNAFKKLRKYPCDRTPNLSNDSYVRKCTASNKAGDLFCDPIKKF